MASNQTAMLPGQKLSMVQQVQAQNMAMAYQQIDGSSKNVSEAALSRGNSIAVDSVQGGSMQASQVALLQKAGFSSYAGFDGSSKAVSEAFQSRGNSIVAETGTGGGSLMMDSIRFPGSSQTVMSPQPSNWTNNYTNGDTYQFTVQDPRSLSPGPPVRGGYPPADPSTPLTRMPGVSVPASPLSDMRTIAVPVETVGGFGGELAGFGEKSNLY